MESSLGLSHFLTQSDAVGRAALLLLLLFSVVSWTLILTRLLAGLGETRRTRAFLAAYAGAATRPALALLVNAQTDDHAFARLARCALDDGPAVPEDTILALNLRQVLDEEAVRCERGLTFLASAGSAAPYVGLFGTVWGIYHALVNIGMAGQGTLDKVAGPVGEALIMTALGLAVAIPAVLAYNGFVRRNRVWLARIEAFAHQLRLRLARERSAGAGDA